MRRATVWALLGLFDLFAAVGLKRAALWALLAAGWVEYRGHVEPESDAPPWRDR